jgi:hypothetical protein
VPVHSGTGKVSVILPRAASATLSTPVYQPPLETEEKIMAVLQVDEEEIEAELNQIREAAELKKKLGLASKEKPSPQTLDDIPTLASHIPYLPADKTEVSDQELVAEKPESTLASLVEKTLEPAKLVPAPDGSLNEKLKPSGKELADHLQGSPVRDLRKAIGINDRYVYINELFRGNEAMFDRALKTLNDFSILPEAEYWMQRELRIKLGWRDEDPAVQQFVQLIKRRFS